jgi:hypothetical protein
MYVKEVDCRWRKVAQWSNCVAGDFGAQAGLTSRYPGAAILLRAWSYKTVYNPFRRCFVATDHGRIGTLGAVEVLESTAEFSRYCGVLRSGLLRGN